MYISSDSSFVASAEDEDLIEPGKADSRSLTHSFLLLLCVWAALPRLLEAKYLGSIQE